MLVLPGKVCMAPCLHLFCPTQNFLLAVVVYAVAVRKLTNPVLTLSETHFLSDVMQLHQLSKYLQALVKTGKNLFSDKAITSY